jgi:hypothetical protein
VAQRRSRENHSQELGVLRADTIRLPRSIKRPERKQKVFLLSRTRVLTASMAVCASKIHEVREHIIGINSSYDRFLPLRRPIMTKSVVITLVGMAIFTTIINPLHGLTEAGGKGSIII